MGAISLVEFMREGGWGMWPTLVLGVAALGTSTAFAAKPVRRRLSRAVTLAVACLVTMTIALMSNVDAVLRFVTDPANVPDAEVHDTLRAGLLEASRPGMVGVVLLLMIGFALVVGILRREALAPKAALAEGNARSL
jgi:hypothetical protein